VLNDPALTGVCCINMDDKVTDEKIDAIFEAVNQ
jgi:DNA replicative helicase MCM subunit Mcm2 (Cdc46/Mcm family)